MTDTGIGIAKGSLQTIFDSFSRANIERNRNILGTGLGLAITKELVSMMGGDISVRSEEGVGSTFTIRIAQKILSNVPGSSVTDFLMHTGREEKETERPVYDGARVLIVDDNTVNLRIASMLLKPYGIDAQIASSGEACLKECADTHFDIVLLDHLMPEMDGEQTLRALRSSAAFNKEETKVVALTAVDDPGARERFIGMGFDDFLTKPIDTKNLEQLLSAYLKKEHAHGI